MAPTSIERIIKSLQKLPDAVDRLEQRLSGLEAGTNQPKAKKAEVKKPDPERKKEQKFQQKKFEPKEAISKEKVVASERVATYYDATDNVELKSHLRVIREEMQKEPTPDQWNNVLRQKLRDIRGMTPTTLADVDREIQREIENDLVAHYYENAALYKGVDISSDFRNLAESTNTYVSRTKTREANFRVGNEAVVTKPKNTNEWAQEIEPQVRAGKFPPLVEPDGRLKADLQAEILSHLNDDSVRWLTGGQMPQSDLGVQIIHDIVNNPDPSKEYLYVKGSQLIHSERLSMDVAHRTELSEYNTRFREEVGSRYGKDTSIPEDKIQKIKQELFEETLVREKKSFDSRGEILDDVIGGMDPDADRDLIVVFKQLAERLSISGENHENALVNFSKELEKPRYFDAMHRNPEAIKYASAKRAELNELFEKNQALREKHRGWSSLYVSYEDMMRSVQTPEAFIREKQDQSNLESAQFEDDWAQSGSREYQQLLQYIHSEDYRTHLREYLMEDSKDTRDAISLVSGTRLTREMQLDGSHPWHQRTIMDGQFQEYRDELSMQVRCGGMLRQGRALMNSGQGLEKLPAVFSQIGDHLDAFVLNQRNGFASDVFAVMDEKLGHYWIDPKTGLPRSLVGGDFAELKGKAIDMLYEQRGQYADKWKGWQGSFKKNIKTGKIEQIDIMDEANKDLVRLELRKAVEEVYFYQILSGREVKLFQKAPTPLEASANKWAGQPGEGQLLSSVSPFKWVLYRWGVLNPMGRLVTRNMFHTEAERYGLGDLWREKMAGIRPGSEEFNKIAQWAFFISKPDDAQHVQNALSCLSMQRKDGLIRSLFDKKHEGLKRNPPTTLDKLSMEDLREQVLFRAGMELLDGRISGAYQLVDSGWNITAKLDAIRDLAEFKSAKGIFLQERAKMDFADYIGAVTHDKMHEAQEHMIARAGHKDHHGHVIHHDGTIVELAKYDPSSILEALTTKLHKKALEWVSVNASQYASLFGDKKFGETLPLTASRPDIMYQGLSMRRRLVDNLLSDKKLGALDYSKWGGDLSVFTSDEQAALNSVFGNDAAKVKLYLDCTKSLSDFALQESILKDTVNPIYGTYFMGVSKTDARTRWIDSNPDKALRYSNRVSAIIGGEGAGGGHARWAGDASNASKAVGEHLLQIIQATNVKDFEGHFNQFLDKILFVGGEGAKDNTAIALFDGWGEAVLSDGIKDFFGMISENNIWATSSAQRAMGLGLPSLKRDEFDHLMHAIESRIGKIHDINPAYGHIIDKRAGIALNIGKLRISTIRAYNLMGGGMQLAALLAIAAYEQSRKGAKDSGGSGGGGGGEAHH